MSSTRTAGGALIVVAVYLWWSTRTLGDLPGQLVAIMVAAFVAGLICLAIPRRTR